MPIISAADLMFLSIDTARVENFYDAIIRGSKFIILIVKRLIISSRPRVVEYESEIGGKNNWYVKIPGSSMELINWQYSRMIISPVSAHHLC